MEKDLTPKRKLFAEAYAATMNATVAAVRAGYSEATARSAGSRLMANVAVRVYVNKLLAEKSADLKLDRESLLNELKELALGPGRDMVKVKAIKLAGDLLGLFGPAGSQNDGRGEKSKSDAVDAVLAIGEEPPGSGE